VLGFGLKGEVARLKTFLLLNLVIFFSSLSFSSIEDYFPPQPDPSSSNLGESGLYVMPNARFSEEGVLKFGISASYPNEYTSITASPFSWMEASFRYTEIKNKLYGPARYSGNQSLKDKGFDVRFRIINESYILPSVALGIRDLGGTGLSSSEYIVASKLFGNLDITLGLGFGLLGNDQNINNPFKNLHDSFNTRASSLGQGGTLNSKDWFSGDQVALFGGLEYRIPKYGLSLKAEYDTTNPDRIYEQNIPLEVKSRVNFGLSYSWGQWADINLSLERGSEVRLSFFLKGNYGKSFLVPKLDKPKNVIPLNEEQRDIVSENKDLFYRSLNLGLKQENIYIQGATLTDNSIDVIVGQQRFRSHPRTVGRTARIASALSPSEVEEITIYSMNGDLEVGAVKLNRSEFEKADNDISSTNELLYKSTIYSTSNVLKQSDFLPTVKFPEFYWKMTPALKHQIGGPEAFYLGQLWWRVDMTTKFARGLSLYTSLGFDLYNNFNELNNPSGATIPHVRSDIQDYLKEGKNNIAKLKLEYIWSPYKDIFARFDIGLLEEMFGGFGGEVLYRPFNSNLSLGLMYHKVKQREYKQRFGFRDYETETGFLEVFYDWPSKVTSQLLIGKYLAGDKGATLDLSKGFKTGMRVGVFATFTDLSYEEFGEGSFDKGFYFSIPMDVFYPRHQTGQITFGLHPLTKDGGAMLYYHNALYGLLGDTNRDAFEREWENILD